MAWRTPEGQDGVPAPAPRVAVRQAPCPRPANRKASKTAGRRYIQQAPANFKADARRGGQGATKNSRWLDAEQPAALHAFTLQR
jgi:hypothetical protein